MRHSSTTYNFGFRVLVAESGEHGTPISAAVVEDARLDLVAYVDHAAAAVSRTVEVAPEVLVIDEEPPGGAIAAAVELCARMPGLPLLITHGPGRDGLVEALAAGASGYVARDARQAEIVQAIVDV